MKKMYIMILAVSAVVSAVVCKIKYASVYEKYYDINLSMGFLNSLPPKDKTVVDALQYAVPWAIGAFILTFVVLWLILYKMKYIKILQGKNK